MLWMAVVIVLCLGVAGCIKSEGPGGETYYRVDPNIAAEVERDVAVGITILQALSIIWPELLPAGLLIATGGGLAVWKKLKPQLTEAQTRQALYYATTEGVVGAIEQFKETNPTEWKKLKKQLDDLVGPEAENVIRALRGLPAKT